MSKNHLSESETLDEKIKRIRKKNEEIEKRRLEVEADKQSAAKLNALVQLSSPKEDWPPPRSYISEESSERPSFNTQEKNRERNRGTVTFDNSFYEGKRLPPDPAYKFLADAERDPIPNKTSSKYQQIKQGRGRAAPRSRGRGNRTNVRENPPLNERDTPGYEAWRAERNRIDEERIRRQRTAQGQWRREWDNQKSEDDWKTPNNHGRREKNEAQNNRITSLIATSEFTQRKLMPRNQVSEEGLKRDSGNKKLGRNADLFPDFQSDSVSSNAEKPMKSAIPLNSSQHSGLHVSFVNDACSQKAPSRRHVAGSGRLGTPPAGPRRSGGGLQCGEGSSGAGPQPQRRIREARRRRRAPAAARSQRKMSTGDDSWEDADEPSEGEGDAAVTPANPTTPLEDRIELRKLDDEESKSSRVSCTLMTGDSHSTLPDKSSSVKTNDSCSLLHHSSNDTTPPQNSDPDPFEDSENADCADVLLKKNPLPENSVSVVGKENSGGKKETIAPDVGVTSVTECYGVRKDEALPFKALQSVDESVQNKSSTEEDSVPEAAALEKEGMDSAKDFHSILDSVDRKDNEGISTIDSSTTAAIESRAADLERDITAEILDVHPKSSMIIEDKMPAQNQDEIATTHLISEGNAKNENASNSNKSHKEVDSVQSTINLSVSDNMDCILTNDGAEVQITPRVEESKTICESISCIDFPNKEILTIDKNFIGADNAENDDPTNIVTDLSQDLVNLSKEEENNLMSDKDQILQHDCSTSDIIGVTSQSNEMRVDQNQNRSQEGSGNTAINFDKAEVSRNITEKSSISTPEENVSGNL